MTSPIIEHCVFTWKIQNFSLCRRESSSRIFSPYFKPSLGSATEWYLDLHLCMKVKQEKGMFLDLVRCAHDEGSERVAASFKVQFSYLNVLSYEESNRNHFGKGEKFRFSKISTLDDVLGCKRDGTDDCAVFTCEMIVIAKYKPLDDNMDVTGKNLLDLSKSMKALICSDKWGDMTLQSDGGEYSIHKAVLSARSEEFKKVFEGELQSSVSLKDVPNETMKHLLLYIYTGKISKGPFIPADLFECAQRFRLPDLEVILLPIKISAESCIEVKTSRLEWNVNNFSSWKKAEEKFLDSPLFGSCFCDVRWTVRLSKNFTDLKTARRLQMSPTSYAFFVQCHNEMVGNPASVEVSFSNGKETFFSAEQVITITPRKKNYFITLVDKNLIYEKLLSSFGDLLKISCKIRLSTGSLTRSHYETVIASKISLNQSTRSLSSDLMNLLESGMFSDYTFVSKDKEHKVHKCILLVRCPTFEGMVVSNASIRLDFADLESEVMDTFLRYIYSGIIDVTDVKMVLNLWPLAKKFGIHRLKKICYRLLRSNLNVDNVCDAMVLIDSLGIPCMFRVPVKKFISKNFSEVILTEKWEKLREENITLLLEFYPEQLNV